MKKGKIGDKIIILIMIIICIITLYPVYYTIVLSFNDANDAMQGGIYLWPRQPSLENYRHVFKESEILRAFGITISRTLIGTVLSVLFTALVAFAFSKKYIFANKFYLTVGTITMFFGGGLIPYFILLRNLGLYNNFLVYIIPSLFNFFNCIIFMTFFREMPASLEESAKLDGANDFVIFFLIILPLSMPIIATIGLFNGVWHWNDYFSGVIFIADRELQPIQTYLYRVIAQSSQTRSVVGQVAAAQNVSTQSLRFATMVITTAPIICIYPFLQRYFVKGIMIGAIKG